MTEKFNVCSCVGPESFELTIPQNFHETYILSQKHLNRDPFEFLQPFNLQSNEGLYLWGCYFKSKSQKVYDHLFKTLVESSLSLVILTNAYYNQALEPDQALHFLNSQYVTLLETPEEITPLQNVLPNTGDENFDECFWALIDIFIKKFEHVKLNLLKRYHKTFKDLSMRHSDNVHFQSVMSRLSIVGTDKKLLKVSLPYSYNGCPVWVIKGRLDTLSFRQAVEKIVESCNIDISIDLEKVMPDGFMVPIPQIFHSQISLTKLPDAVGKKYIFDYGEELFAVTRD